MRVLKRLFASAFVALAIAASGSALHPFGHVRKEKSRGSLLEGGEIDGGTLSILERACQNCHSERTDWPWYSHVAPVSWLLVDDVNSARGLFNLSEWARLDRDRQDRKLRQICDEVEDGGMPLWYYTPLHRGSKLSPADVKTLCDWTNAERARLSSITK